MPSSASCSRRTWPGTRSRCAGCAETTDALPRSVRRPRGRRAGVAVRLEGRGRSHRSRRHPGEGLAAQVLTELGITAPAVRDLVVEIIGRGKGGANVGSIPFTPRAKNTVEYAWGEARARGSEQVGPEHLLLGVLRDSDGVGGQIITKLAADTDQVRRKLEKRMNWRQRSESAVTSLLADDAGSWATFGRRHHLIGELNAVLDENERLHEQVAHLRDLLRRHGIDPDS